MRPHDADDSASWGATRGMLVAKQQHTPDNVPLTNVYKMKSRELGPEHSTQSVARYASAAYFVNSFRFFQR